MKTEELKAIERIATRAARMAADMGIDYDYRVAFMDMKGAHFNGCPLDLDGLANASDYEFSHDVFGIRQHTDRNIGVLSELFKPRFSKTV